jgi:hypothetical protein
MPRFREEVPAVVRKKLTTTFATLITERVLTQPPAPATGTVSVPSPLYRDRVWLYWGDGSAPIQVTAQEDWQLVATDAATVGPQSSLTKYLSDYDFSVGAYTNNGFGVSPLVDIWIWVKEWNDSAPEPSIWDRRIGTCRKTQESLFKIIDLFTGSSQTRNTKVEIYVRDRQTCYLSLSGRDVFLYSEIASWDVNDRHGGFYTKVPYRATALPDANRFSDYPTFDGNAKDWRRGYPNFAVDGIYGDLGLCFTNDYDRVGVNSSGRFRYGSTLGFQIIEKVFDDIEVPVFRYPIRENTPDSCVVGVGDIGGDIGAPDKEFIFRYKGASPTEFPTYGESYFRVLFLNPVFSQV